MTLTKVNRRSGQITLPKRFRDQFDTDTYQCFIEDYKCTFIPISISVLNKKKGKSSLEETIEELDNVLEKIDWGNLPSLKDQLKDV